MIKQSQQRCYLNKWIVAVTVLFSVVYTNAQKHDYVWLGGYGSQWGLIDSTYGITKLDFNYTSLNVSYDSLGMSFSRTACSMSSKDGNLLFYSNGNYISNKWDEKIFNSDSLSFGYVSYVLDSDIATDGQRIDRIVTSISSPVNPNLYYVFHILMDTLNKTDTITSKVLYLTILNPNDSFGKGHIVEKKMYWLEIYPVMK